MKWIYYSESHKAFVECRDLHDAQNSITLHNSLRCRDGNGVNNTTTIYCVPPWVPADINTENSQADVIDNLGISIWVEDEDGDLCKLSPEDQTIMIQRTCTSGEYFHFDTIDTSGRGVGFYNVCMSERWMMWFSYTEMREDSMMCKFEIRFPLITMWKLAVANSFPVLQSDVRWLSDSRRFFVNVFLLTRDVIRFRTESITDVSRGRVHDFVFSVHLTGACIPNSMFNQELIRNARRVNFCLNLTNEIWRI